jgi:hypothetical protein
VQILSVLGSTAAAREAARRAGGNPFFSLSLFRSLETLGPGNLPESLLDSLRAQLSASGNKVQQSVRLVALAGNDVDLNTEGNESAELSVSSASLASRKLAAATTSKAPAG